MAGIFDTGIFDTGIFDNGGAAATGPTQGGGPGHWKGPVEPAYQVHPEYADKPKRKKKRVITEGPQVVIESDVTTQTGIIETPAVTPARNVLAEMQQKQAEANQARAIAEQQRIRAIALADDEWLMVA